MSNLGKSDDDIVVIFFRRFHRRRETPEKETETHQEKQRRIRKWFKWWGAYMKATSGTIFSRQNTKCSYRFCYFNDFFFKFHRKRLPVPVLVTKKNHRLKEVEKTFAKSSKIRNSVNQPKQLPSLKLIVENV